MSVCDTSCYGETLLYKIQYMYDYDKRLKKSCGAHVKNPEVNGQRRMRIVNVFDTSSHKMCQIIYANVKSKKKLRVGREDISKTI